MENTPITDDDWAQAAVALLLKRCSDRAAKDLEAQAARLLLAASRLRGAAQ